jgi:hypothetical protein
MTGTRGHNLRGAEPGFRAAAQPGASAAGNETDAEYLDRIEREIAAGLEDLQAGNIVSAAEHREEMERFMSELRESYSKTQTARR